MGFGPPSMFKASAFPKSKCIIRCQAAALSDDYDPKEVVERRIQAQRPAESPLFLYVGRLSAEKGIETLLAAFTAVLRKLPSSRLKLVGDGPSKAALQFLAADLGITGSVDFTGGVQPEAIASSYLESTCLVLPSFSEPWGLVVNEALAYGCPVLVSNRCGCVPEMASNPLTGMVFEAGDSAQLAERLLAAPGQFKDWGATANRCLHEISTYTPRNAAQAILEGVTRNRKR